MDPIPEETSAEMAANLADLTLRAPTAGASAPTAAQEAAKGDWADYSVSDGEEPEEEADPLNETLLPVRNNRGMSRRELKAMEDTWGALRARLDNDLRLIERANVAVDTAACELDAFIRQYGAEGRNIAKSYRRRMAYAVGQRKAAQAWQAQEEKRMEKRRNVEERILAFRRRTIETAEATRAEAEALQAELNELRDRDPVKGKPSKAYRCPKCGLTGVHRGEECPNLLEHRRA